MVDITQLDHVEEGLSQLPSQWENSPRVRGLLESWLRQLNTFESNLIDVRDGFNMQTAIGAQLDIIGGYFSVNRLGRSDSDYRNAILTVIASGNGSGTPDQMISLFSSMANTGDVQYWEHPPLSFTMLANNGDESGASDAQYMSSAKPAGTEFAAVMYDPYGYCWIGYEATVQQDQIIDNLGNDIVDDLNNKIVANIIVDGIDDGTKRYSFVDQIDDGELEFGYGVNYGGNYGGSQERYSWLAEASFVDNSIVTSGGNGFVEWCDTGEVDSVTGTTNKAKPIKQMSDSGLKRCQPMPRQFFNWLMANIDDWFKHISNRTVVGTFKMTVDNTKTASDYDTLYGGTWASVGTDTYAGETVYVFKRTA